MVRRCSASPSAARFIGTALLGEPRGGGRAAASRIAKALLDDCRQRLTALGPHTSSALVRGGNPRLGFFERVGFRVGHRFHWIECTVPDSGSEA